MSSNTVKQPSVSSRARGSAPRASEAAAGVRQGVWEGEPSWKPGPQNQDLVEQGVLPGPDGEYVEDDGLLPEPGDPADARIRRTVSLEAFFETVEKHYRYFRNLTGAAIWAVLVGREEPFSGTTAVDLEDLAVEFDLEPTTVRKHIENLDMVEVRERTGDRLLVRAHPPKELRRRPAVIWPAERTGFPPGLRSLLKNPAQIAGEDWSYGYSLRNEHGDVVETATKEHRSHTVAARLLVYLSFRTHAAPGEPCRRSDTAVANAIGVSRAYVCSIRNELERDGWLVRLPHLRHDGETRAPVTAAEPHMEGDDGVYQQVHHNPGDDGGETEQTGGAETDIYSPQHTGISQVDKTTETSVSSVLLPSRFGSLRDPPGGDAAPAQARGAEDPRQSSSSETSSADSLPDSSSSSRRTGNSSSPTTPEEGLGATAPEGLGGGLSPPPIRPPRPEPTAASGASSTTRPPAKELEMLLLCRKLSGGSNKVIGD